MRRSILALLVITFLWMPSALAVVGLLDDVSKGMADEDAHSLFPAADYPFVQKPNHCGANDWTHIIPERPFCFKGPGNCTDDFTQACDLHDRCYMWLGISRKDCDTAFLESMQNQCQLAPTPFKQGMCRKMAKVYYEAVRLKAGAYYHKIQKKQSLYETWLKVWQDEKESQKSARTEDTSIR